MRSVVMTVKNIKTKRTIVVASRRGQPIITKGFISIECGKNHMGCEKLSEAVLYKDFEWDGK